MFGWGLVECKNDCLNMYANYVMITIFISIKGITIEVYNIQHETPLKLDARE